MEDKMVDISEIKRPPTLIEGAFAEFPLLRSIDSVLIARMSRAVEANGGDWPDSFGRIPVDENGLGLGGNHRLATCDRAGITQIPVTVYDMPDISTEEGIRERLLFAVRDNASHGQRWSSKQEAEVQIILEKHGIETREIAEALRIPVQVVERKPIVNVVRGGKKKEPKRIVIPKPVIAKFKHRSEVTEREAEVMQSIATPHGALVHCREILRLAELDALPHLDADAYAVVRETISRLEEWVTREGDRLGGRTATG